MPLQNQCILAIDTLVQALPSLLEDSADTSTFLTDDSPVPSDSLVNFNTATL